MESTKCCDGRLLDFEYVKSSLIGIGFDDTAINPKFI